MKRDESLIYINKKGQSIEFSVWSPFFLESVEGLDGLSNTIYTNKGINQDGVNYVNDSLEPRNILIQGTISNEKENRKTLLNIINPKLAGRLIYINSQLKRQIKCRVEVAPRIKEDLKPKFTISFLCPNPYWESLAITEEPLAAFVELFEFPTDYWDLEDDGDIYFEVGFVGEKRQIEVVGDVEVPIKIKLYGPSTNPKITNHTRGEFIRVNKELSKEDVMLIDTDEATVSINGENAFHLIDINSSFWKLKHGKNTVEYTADSGVEEARLEISWNERYVGV